MNKAIIYYEDKDEQLCLCFNFLDCSASFKNYPVEFRGGKHNSTLVRANAGCNLEMSFRNPEQILLKKDTETTSDSVVQPLPKKKRRKRKKKKKKVD